jgi:CheY-like chemotaxis protein
MDVRMPGMNGIEATTRLVQGGTRARILMLTTFHLDEYVYHALKAGASGGWAPGSGASCRGLCRSGVFGGGDESQRRHWSRQKVSVRRRGAALA